VPGTSPIASGSGDEATAALLDNIAGTVFTAGDNVYPDGTDAQFAQCYDPSWGRHKARTRPTPGNHDYHTSGASGYYGYFGSLAGPSGQGYYSYDIGAWHVILAEHQRLHECRFGAGKRGCARTSRPAPSSAPSPTGTIHGSARGRSTQHVVGAAVVAGAVRRRGRDRDLRGTSTTTSGFAPQTPTGTADPTRGIREFVVGTGGESH